MRRSRLKREKARAVLGQTLFRPVHAVCAHTPRQRSVACNEQDQAALAGKSGELARDAVAVFRAKMTVNHGYATRQFPCDGKRIGRAHGISEEIERWNGGRPRRTVEPSRLRR